MATKLPAKDVVIIGLGWTGAILAHELTDQGLDVVAIERGPWRDTATSFNIGYAPDELRYGVRLDLFQRPAQSTLTFRNNDRADGAADPAMGLVPARQRRRRRWRPLGRANLAPSADRFSYAQPSHRALRRELHTGRAVDPGLGRHLRRVGAVLRPLRVSLPASPAKPAISTASSSRAAIRSKGRASATIRCRRCR